MIVYEENKVTNTTNSTLGAKLKPIDTSSE